ncbi:MAG: T9SS type A sorting domain-containing protein [Flavobacteriales bacterium]|nr:T9SS type A sorting domain-containing protein [Flavobacteriales bacterium]
MKKVFPLLLILAYWFNTSIAQTSAERFVHCLGTDTFSVEKVSELVLGDTVIKEYFDHSDLNNPENTTFAYYFFNDSTFIKYDNRYYFIGDDNAQIGDVWHPIRFQLNSYSDTTENCPFLMNLEVVDIDTVNIDGVPTKYFMLNDLDWSTPNIIDHKYLEGIGVTMSGPYYNFSQELPCDVLTEVPITFLSYYSGNFEFKEGSCVTSVQGELSDEDEIMIYPNPTDERLCFELPNTTKGFQEVEVRNMLGEIVFRKSYRDSYKSINSDCILVSGYKRGPYILRLTCNNSFYCKPIILNP